MTRFFVTPEELERNEPVLTGENFQHAKVLRLKNGEAVMLCDGQGFECICTVTDVGSSQIALELVERRASETEAAVRVSVYMAFPKADKLEHVIQKATELGVYEIVAFPSARCVSKPDDKSLKKKAGAVAENRGICCRAIRQRADPGGFGAVILCRGVEAGGVC